MPATVSPLTGGPRPEPQCKCPVSALSSIIIFFLGDSCRLLFLKYIYHAESEMIVFIKDNLRKDWYFLNSNHRREQFTPDVTGD